MVHQLTFQAPKMSKCSAVLKILTSIAVRGLLQRITWATNNGPPSKQTNGPLSIFSLLHGADYTQATVIWGTYIFYKFLDKIKPMKKVKISIFGKV